LLILVRLLGQFDGEQGLHAGVQIEDLTGPSGTNNACVGMLEAVHRPQLIMLGLLPFAQREVKMPSQVVIIHPGLAGLPIGFAEQPTVGIPGDGGAAFVDGGVMPLT
jgi:hypothetical protein